MRTWPTGALDAIGLQTRLRLTPIQQVRGLLIPQVGLPSRCVPARPRGVEDQATVLHLLTKRREDLVAARTPDHQPAAPGEVGDVGRFPTTHHFAAHTGTAPLEASSGQVVRHRLSRAGDRKLNHALYMMAMVQVRRPSAGQVYDRRKLAEGKSPKEALRCLKRRLSDAVYRCLLADQHLQPTLIGPTPG